MNQAPNQSNYELEKLRLKIASLELENSQLMHERQQPNRFSDQPPPMISLLHGPEHILGYSNWAMRQFLGYGNYISEPIRNAQPELDGQGLFEGLDQAYNTAKPVFGNVVSIKIRRAVSSQSEERVINYVYQPHKTLSGEVDNVQILAFDVTEKVHNFRGLRWNAHLLHSFAPSITQIAWVAGPTGKIETYSPNWYTYTGLTEESSLALNGWQRIVHPQEQVRCEKEWRKWLLDGEPYQSIFRLKDVQTGLYNWFLGRTISIRDAQGRLLSWFGVLTNVERYRYPRKLLSETVLDSYNLTVSDKLGSLVVDPAGLIYEANQLAQSMLGYQREELVSGSIRWKDLVPGDESEAESDVDRILRHQGIAEPRLRTFITRDGSPLNVLVGGTLLDFRRELVVLLFQVIPQKPVVYEERNSPVSQLKTEYDRYKAVIENIPIGAVLANVSDGRIVFRNAHFDHIIRRPINQDHTMSTFTEPIATYADGTTVLGERWPLARALNGEVIQGDEILYEYMDGTKKWLRVSANPVRDQSGNIVGATAAVVDFDNEKRTEERLRFLSEISKGLVASLDYEETLQNAARLVVQFLADWCIIDVLEPNGKMNSIGIAHLDLQREELVRELSRRYWSEFSMPEHLVTRVLKSGKSITRFNVAEGQPFIQYNPEHQAILDRLGLNSLMLVPITANGQILGTITLVRSRPGRYYEPADLELAEEFGRRAGIAIDHARSYQAARTAIKNRDDFLSVASHEMKTPLTGLRGYAQLLMRQYDNGGSFEPESLRESLEAIDYQSEKLTNLMAQLLDFTRVEIGHLTIAPFPTDLISLLENVIETMQLTNPGHKLVLRATGQADAMIDPVRFEQVIINLLDNALKFSLEGGSIEIDVGEEDRFIKVSITDHGIGIPVEHRPHIFERFYQAHAGNELKGMGLGLHISAEIIALHEGLLLPEFPDEGGTRFIIKVPRMG